MKNILLISASFIFCAPMLMGADQWNASLLTFSTDAPEVRYYIQDSNGRRAGADPDRSMDPNGEIRSGDEIHVMVEIPGSSVDQINLMNDVTEEADDDTAWEVYLFDSPKQELTLYYSSIRPESMWEIGINYSPKGGKLVHFLVPVVARAGTYGILKIQHDPHKPPVITRQVNSGQLSKDVKSACNAGLIGPRYSCAVLENLAKSVEVTLENINKDHEKSERHLRLFLRILDKLHKADKDLDWGNLPRNEDLKPWRKDCGELFRLKKKQVFVKDPAYTILKEEVLSLLAIAELKEKPKPIPEKK